MKTHIARGTSLVEALVALLVMAGGLLAALALQAQLRAHADEARHRLVALQLAQQSLEDARDAWAHGGAAALVAQEQAVDAGGASFAVSRAVRAPDATGWQVSAQVAWAGRERDEQLSLHTELGAGDPPLWMALVEGPADGVTRLDGATGHPGVPPSSTPLGGPRAWLRPHPHSPWGWLIDTRSARISHTCTVNGAPDLTLLAQADAGLCTPQAQPSVLVSGHVRHSLAGSADEAHDPVPELGVQLRLTSEPHLSPPVCAAQALGSVTHYYCAVLLRSPTPQDPGAYWSGRTELIGLPVGDGGFRVCRRSGDRNGNRTIDNDEHPASYVRVTQSLRHQHFLLVPHALPCPAGVVGQGDTLRDTATVQHQP